MSAPDPSLLNHYMWSMARASRAFEDTEAVFKAVLAEYQEKHGEGVTADYAAASDTRLQQAISDGGWQRDRSQTFALNAIAVLLHEIHALLHEMAGVKP